MSAAENGENLEASFAAGGNEKQRSRCANARGLLKTLNTELPRDPATPRLGVCSCSSSRPPTLLTSQGSLVFLEPRSRKRSIKT